MMTAREALTLIGDNYNLIRGMEEYIANLRNTDPAAAEKFVKNVSKTPTAYYKLLEVMVGGEELPAVIENKAKVRFASNSNYKHDLGRRLMYANSLDEKFDVTDVVRYISRQNHEDYVIPLDPGQRYVEFGIMEGDRIMDEIEAEIGFDIGPNFHMDEDVGLVEMEVATEYVNVRYQTDPQEAKRALAEKCAQAKVDYDAYMKELKKTDPKEYKRITALHSIYKKENSKLADIEAKIEKIDQEIDAAGYFEKMKRGELTEKEDKKWDELADKQDALLTQKRELREKYREENDKRVEKGEISERHAEIRAEQLFNGDFTSLPMRKWEETKAAGQCTQYEIDEETQEKIYIEEYEFLKKPELDNVTKDDPAVIEDARRIEEENQRASERIREIMQARLEELHRNYQEERKPLDLGEKGVVIDKPTQKPIQKEEKEEKVEEKEAVKEEEERSVDE